MSNLKLWTFIGENVDLIKVYYYQTLPIWEKIAPLKETISNLHIKYDQLLPPKGGSLEQNSTPIG